MTFKNKTHITETSYNQKRNLFKMRQCLNERNIYKEIGIMICQILSEDLLALVLANIRQIWFCRFSWLSCINNFILRGYVIPIIVCCKRLGTFNQVTTISIRNSQNIFLNKLSEMIYAVLWKATANFFSCQIKSPDRTCLIMYNGGFLYG